MPYLALRSGTFYLRLAVPKSLQPMLGQAEIFQNLKTGNREEARVLALSLTAELLLKFSTWKTALKNKKEEERLTAAHSFLDGIFQQPSERPLADPPAVNASKYDLDVTPDGRFYIKHTDPQNPQDHLNAMEALKSAQASSSAFPAPAMPAVPLSAPEAPQAMAELATVLEKLQGTKPKNIHSAFAEYSQELKTRGVKSADHCISGLKHFIEWITQQHPNIQVHKIRKDQMKDYRQVLLEKKRRKNSPLTLHPHNVYKRLGFVETFFRYCQEQEYIPAGDIKLPTHGIKGKKPDYDDSETSYLPFTQPELLRLFSAENYQPLYKAPHLFWAPLLGLLQGARRGEIANIHPDAINNANKGIWTMSFTRMLKNKNSRRSIPLHAKLIELGFLEYMEDVRRIFPQATSLFPYTWNIGKYIGEGFAEHCDATDISDSRKVFHSFRKNVAATLLNAGVVEQKYREHFIGHLKYSLHESVYSGKENPMKFYANLINTHLVYDLNLDHLKYQRGMFDEKLQLEKIAQDRKAKFGTKKGKSAPKATSKT